MAEEQTETMASDIPTTLVDAAAEQPAAAEPVSLSVEDLVNVLRVINVASERGAFKAPELSSVGVVHDRIAKFVEASQKAAAENADGEATDGGE